MMRLAKDLGKTLEEIGQISEKEFKFWHAFYDLEQDEYKKELEKSKSNPPPKPRARRR